MRIVLIVAFFCLSALSAAAGVLDTTAGRVSVVRVMAGLEQPWGLAFLPDGGFLVTERGGRLIYRAADGAVNSVGGVPKVAASGQGGLLDVMVARDFSQSREIFLSFARKQGRGSGTALAVGELSRDGRRISNLRIIFEMTRGSSGGIQFGSRIVEARDGTIFLTIGDRGDKNSAQDLSRQNGSVIRINRDGSIPGDNPFVATAGVSPEIWSYGHRNPQGAALDLVGDLWINEHGARGGDEVNRISPGANYGWPVISYGTNYNGSEIGEGTVKPGMEQPAFFWDPSIAPSGLMIYSGKLWPEWRGDFFIGSLKFDYISRLDPDDGWREEVLTNDDTIRVRDIREAADGSIWFLSVGEGAVFRMTPR